MAGLCFFTKMPKIDVETTLVEFEASVSSSSLSERLQASWENFSSSLQRRERDVVALPTIICWNARMPANCLTYFDSFFLLRRSVKLKSRSKYLDVTNLRSCFGQTLSQPHYNQLHMTKICGQATSHVITNGNR